MSLYQLLSELSDKNVQLSVVDENLKIRAPKGVLSSELQERLRSHKHELLEMLLQKKTEEETSSLPLAPVPRNRVLPLSSSQLRLWLFHQLEGENAAYNIPFAIRFDGPLQPSALEKSLAEIIQRHEVFRTIFPQQDGIPVQKITAPEVFRLSLFDLQDRPEEQQAEDARRIMEEDARTPFDLEEGPLFRIRLLQLGSEHYFLFINIHHIIFDVWSLQVFFGELTRLYRAFSEGKASPLPDLSIQYADFAVWEEQWLRGSYVQKHLAYWKSRLLDVPTILELPCDYPRPAALSYTGDTQRIEFSAALSEQLRGFSREQGVTLFTTLCTIFQLLLYKFSQQNSFLLGTSDANRFRKELEPLIGFLVNQLLLRADLSDNQTFSSLLKHVHQEVLDMHKHKSIPFSQLVREIQPDRNSGRNPLFQVLFILQNTAMPRMDFDKSLDASLVDIPTHCSRLDSMVTIYPHEEGFSIYWEYSTELFEEETIRLLLQTFQTFAEEAIRSPEQSLAMFDLPEVLLQKVQQARQLQTFSKTLRLHHLGFACRDIHKGIAHVKTLYDVTHSSEIVFDDLQNVSVCMLETSNGASLELVSGTEVESLIQQGISLYQTCYETPDIFQAIEAFMAQGAVLVSEPKPAKLFDNRLVAFLNTELGLIELLEMSQSADSARRAKGFAASMPQQDSLRTVAIAASFTAEPVKEVLDFWFREHQFPFQVEFSPYHQIFQQLLDPESLLAKNTQGINCILFRFEDWLKIEQKEMAADFAATEIVHALEGTIDDFTQALQSVVARSEVPWIIGMCPASPGLLQNVELAECFSRLEQRLQAGLSRIRNIILLRSEDLLAEYPVERYDDPHSEQIGHVPFTSAFFAALGTTLIRRIAAMQRQPYKVIVLDCDNTLWGGVCGEDGSLGVRLDAPYIALQHFMRQQHDAGMLLCLCSKNSEEDVSSVFENRPEMILTREHLAGVRINWEPKSENLRSLAQELNLGLDSFIFLDDNPLECAEVEANCPEVLTLQLPSVPDHISDFLKHVWAFDHLRVTEEDTQRTIRYRQNAQREQARRDSLTFQRFLEQLELKIAIHEPTPEQIPRVAQLIQRTNQFNLTTIRRSEQDIHALCEEQGYECLVTEVSDRFGEYGLVGVLLFRVNSGVLDVDSFLLSCRALGRGVEHKMLAELGQLALDRRLEEVNVRYVRSLKNQPAFDFLKNQGEEFKHGQEGEWIFRFPSKFAAAAEFQPKETPVEPQKTSGNHQVFKESHALVQRIATELSDADRILNAIAIRKHHVRPELEAEFVAPRTSIEESLAKIWLNVLGLDRVGVYDDFFKLGGHSLLATQILSRITEEFKVNLPLQSLLQNPSIAGIAEQIETVRWAAKRQEDAIAIAAEDREEGEL